MKFSSQELRHIADLARMQLTDEEEAQLTKDMAQILGYVEGISKLDLPEIPQRIERSAAQWREDETEETLPRKDVLDNAARTNEEQITVPPVLPGQEEDI